MNKVIVLVISSLVVVAGGWLARDFALGQATEEKSITMTQSKWEELIQKRIAEALAKAKEDTSDQKIRRVDNWHTAIYNGVEFTIYTGPGQAMIIRSVQPTRPATLPLKPAGDSRMPKPAE